MSSKSRKMARRILSGIIIVAAVVVCVVRWNAWFGNPPEALYTPATAPHHVMLTYNEEAASQRIISWRSDTVKNASWLLLTAKNGSSLLQPDTVVIFPTDTVVETRSGKGVYYRAYLYDLLPGGYKFQIVSDTICSEWYNFVVRPADNLDFIVFGDIQDNKEDWSDDMFRMVDSIYPQADFWAFLGDIIERPTDEYWQYWFYTMGDIPTKRPIVAATGNHEYLKGVIKRIDPRWIHIFGNPDNGPFRSIGTSFYIDFPRLRYIVVDTDGLNTFSDYTITSAWLRRITNNIDSKRWNVVMLHHPIYSAAVGRQNIALWLLLRKALDKVDLVLEGHDHTYARRIGDDCVTPVFVETTSAHKYYMPKVNPKDDRILTNNPVYNRVQISDDTLTFETYLVDDNSLYDRFKIVKSDTSTLVYDFAPQTPEIIELPDRYKDQSGTKIRRFYNRRDNRLKQEKE